MQNITWLIILLLLVTLGLAAWVMRKPPSILDYGYTHQTATDEHITSGFDTIDGEVIQSQATQRTSLIQSTQVPAQVGVTFGFYVTSPKVGLPNTLSGTVTHPPMGAEKRTRQSWPITNHVQSDALFIGYRLEDDFELVQGDWTLTLWKNGKPLFEQSFQLVDPVTLVQD